MTLINSKIKSIYDKLSVIANNPNKDLDDVLEAISLAYKLKTTSLKLFIQRKHSFNLFTNDVKYHDYVMECCKEILLNKLPLIAEDKDVDWYNINIFEYLF